MRKKRIKAVHKKTDRTTDNGKGLFFCYYSFLFFIRMFKRRNLIAMPKSNAAIVAGNTVLNVQTPWSPLLIAMYVNKEPNKI